MLDRLGLENYTSWILLILALFVAVFISVALRMFSRKIFNKHSESVAALLNWGIILVLINYVSRLFKELEWLYSPVFISGNVKISIYLLVFSVFVFLLIQKIANIVEVAILNRVFDKYRIDVGSRYTIVSLLHYIVLLIGFVTSLSILGVSLGSLNVFAGIFGVGIGFGLQNIAQNFISGIILLFDRPIKVGDRVVVNGEVGDVMKIKMRATVLKTLDNENIIIPNSYFLNEKVVNRSYKDKRIRITINVGVAYDSDMEVVKKALLESVDEVRKDFKTILQSPSPEVNFKEIGAYSFNLRLFVWISDAKDEVPITSALYYKIVDKTRQYEIEMPYEQLDLWKRA